uniref:Uncharacterized protein n=1 Tax=Lygus hesperus TaxID=30085 RepID=A0A0A9YEA9_LYGHE
MSIVWIVFAREHLCHSSTGTISHTLLVQYNHFFSCAHGTTSVATIFLRKVAAARKVSFFSLRDTLRVVVPQLGQSLPDLKEATRRWLAPPPRPLAPPPAPPRGSSYPPPSPPLRRSPAIRHNTMDKPEQ